MTECDDENQKHPEAQRVKLTPEKRGESSASCPALSLSEDTYHEETPNSSVLPYQME
jgi:hypothetical protein